MMLTRIKIQNYRCFELLDLPLKSGFNILVGDNGVGKSTILEAVNLALTRRVGRNPLVREISPHLFNNKVSRAYLDAVNRGETSATPPEVIVELYFDGDDGEFSGTNNSEDVKARGVRLCIGLDPDCQPQYNDLVASIDSKKPESHLLSLPTEYFRDEWKHFGGQTITARQVLLKAAFVNTSSSRLEPRADTFTRTLVADELSSKTRSEISHKYRAARESFSTTDSIRALNDALSSYGDLVDSSRKLSLGIDISKRTSWEANIVPHLDELPLDFVGDGERNVLKMLLSLRSSVEAQSQVLLVEEPENFLSPMRLNGLLDRLASLSSDRQAIISTHSAFVMNKLGIDDLVLVGRDGNHRTFKHLDAGTRNYFQVLPGYNTLRVVLAKKLVLVEGPSDDLVFQTTYRGKYGRLPAADLVDVFSVNGTSFRRYLALTKTLEIPTALVMDNDKQTVQQLTERYSDYLQFDNVKLFAGADPAVPSLEEHLLKTNDGKALSQIFGRKYAGDEKLLAWMKDNKTEAAVTLFNATRDFVKPSYIADAAEFIHDAK